MPDIEEPFDDRRPFRVAFLTTDLGGGTGDHVLSMIRLWDRRAWDTRILTAAPLTSKHTPHIPLTQVGMKGRLARFKIPRTFQRVDVLPKTASGKVQKHLLNG